MKHAEAIQAYDRCRTVYANDGSDEGWIKGLGQYDTYRLNDFERHHPMNKRSNAMVYWASGVSTWTPIRDLRVTRPRCN